MTIPTPRFTLTMIRLTPWPFAAYTVARLVTFFAPFAVLLIEQTFFNAYGVPTQPRTLWWMVAAYAAVLCIRLVAVMTECWTNITFRYRAMGTIQHNTVATVLEGTITDTAQIHPLERINRLRDDAGEVADFPLWLPEVIGTTLASIAAFIVMWHIDSRVTLLAVVPFVLQGLIALAFWRVFLRYRYAEGALNDEASTLFGTVLGNALTIRLLQLQQRVGQDVRALGDRRRHTALAKIATQHLATESMVDLSVATASVVSLWLLLPALEEQRLGVGDVLVFVTGVGILAGLPQTWATFVGDYAQQKVSIGRLVEGFPIPLTAILPVRWWKEERRHPAPHVSTPPPRVVLEQVQYIHPDGRGIHDLTVALEPGSFTVIAGRVGAGKSTALELIAGLRSPQAGKAEIVGAQPLAPVTGVAYVPQIAFLASATLRENICWGADATHLDAVVRRCQLDADIARLPAGIDTIVGPRGMRLSGGQRQRVALARALLRDPGLLVLDDVSSALDVHTEASLLRAIRSDRSRTIVASSTRMAFFQAADRIILLDDGRVVASGTYTELFEQYALFRTFCQIEPTAVPSNDA